jgi:hypothetical protein
MTYCKLGDRAIIVHSNAGNEGKVVKIVGDLGYHFKEPFMYAGKKHSYYPVTGKMWEVRSEGFPLKNNCGPSRSTGPIPDAWLRPLPKLSVPEKKVPVRITK